MGPLLKKFLICLDVISALAAISPTFALDKTAPHVASPSDLEGREWQIANYFVNKEQNWPRHEIGQKGQPYITFENGVIAGSPGCGRFIGKYHRAGEQLTISADWTDVEEKSCGDKGREDARRILQALANVKQIHIEPEYWHEDALLLTDAKGADQVHLLPMQTGNDLSELRDTFWHLTQLQGSHADFSDVVIDIQGEAFTFSTSSYYSSLPFRYRLAGLEFFPVSAYSAATQSNRHDQQIAKVLETALHEIGSYKLSGDSLTFFGKDRQPIVVLNSVRQESIENRRWHIAKYRGDGTLGRDDEGLIVAKDTAEITLLKGRVEGSPTCGGWEGTYKLSGDQLTLQADVVLAGFCYPENWAQSQLVVKAFRGDLRIEEKDDHILLRDKNGKAHVLLVPY